MIKLWFKMSLLQNSFSPPLTGGGEGVGELSSVSKLDFHPHPNPPPSRGRGCFFGVLHEAQWKEDPSANTLTTN